MATRYQRRIKTGENSRINVSKSGLSYSVKEGRWTINSRGYLTYNSGIKGLSFRTKNPLAVIIYYLTKMTWFILKWTIFLPFTLLFRWMRKMKMNQE